MPWHRLIVTVLSVLVVCILALAPPAAAEVTNTLSYQGMLTDSSGNAVTGTVNIVFSIYDVETGGTALWTETHTGVTVTDGIYAVVLGSVTPLELPQCVAYWLGINVGGDGEMDPRTPLTGALMGVLPYLGSNTIVVQKTGPGFNSIAAALASITDNDTDHRYTIKVGPGKFIEQVVMKEYVSIVGSGRVSTRIIQPGGAEMGNATLLAASNTELSNLTVVNYGGEAVDLAIAVLIDGASPYIHDVTMIAYGAEFNYAMYLTVTAAQPASVPQAVASSSSPSVLNCRMQATGGMEAVAVWNEEECYPTFSRCRFESSGSWGSNYAVWNTDGSPNFSYSRFTADGTSDEFSQAYGILTSGGSPSFYSCYLYGIGGSDAAGLVFSGGRLEMAHSQAYGYDSASANTGAWISDGDVQLRSCRFMAYNSLTTGVNAGLVIDTNADVKATDTSSVASQGESGVGMDLNGSNFIGSRITSWAQQSDSTIGVKVQNGGDMGVMGLLANAQGYASAEEGDNAGATSTAFQVANSTADVNSSLIFTEYSDTVYLLDVTGAEQTPSEVHVNNSTVSGSGAFVRYGNYTSVYFGGDRLNGSGTDDKGEAGTLKCVNCWNQAYDQLDAACTPPLP